MTIDLSEIRQSLPLRAQTGAAWVETAMANLDGFLCDHASCERKAHAAAMMLVNKFPEFPELQEQMIALAIEELQHFQQVFKIMRQRNLSLGPDEIDCYVKELLKDVRHPRREHLLDRLMVVAMVEARSCERFCLFAEALPEGNLKTFYTEFAKAESAHFPLFVNLAKALFGANETSDALDRWLDIEARVVQTVPYKAGVH
jgi:tRNA-(ms[2]io[6]A)-hydroxylase